MGMSSKKHKNPTIRFNGFTDAWEQRKLEDLAESFNYGLNASAMEFDGENKYIRITDIDEYSHRFIESGLTSPNTNLSNADDYLLKEGDILFARTGASVGKSYQYEPLDGKVYYAGFLIRARIKPEFHSSFIFQNTLTEKYNNFIKITSQRSGQPGVNAQEYANFSIMVPSRGEQVKLGNFFKQLDNAIDLHQRQLENYSQLKNAMIQKIFNKELRFKNENGNDYSDWEKKRLGEILAEVVRKSTKQDQHVILSSTNKGLFLQSEYFISNIASADNIGYKIMRKSEIVFSPQNLWMGNINYNDKYEIGLVSPSYKIFAISEEVIPKFMKYMIKTPYLMNEYLLSSEQGASVVRRNLDMDLFNKILVEIPSLPEQHQIASFLVALDCNIDQLTRKIELVKDKKKGLLQLMFI